MLKTRQNAVNMIAQEAFRMIDVLNVQIEKCTNEGPCNVCIQDRKEISDLFVLLASLQVISVIPLVQNQEPVTTDENKWDKLVEEAVNILGAQYSPY